MLRKFSIRSRLSLLVILPLFALILSVITLLSRMADLNDDIGSLYQDRVVPLQLIKSTSDGFGIHVVDALHKYRGGEIEADEMKNIIQSAQKNALNS